MKTTFSKTFLAHDVLPTKSYMWIMLLPSERFIKDLIHHSTRAMIIFNLVFLTWNSNKEPKIYHHKFCYNILTLMTLSSKEVICQKNFFQESKVSVATYLEIGNCYEIQKATHRISVLSYCNILPFVLEIYVTCISFCSFFLLTSVFPKSVYTRKLNFLIMS